jgi:hypothetical protein
MRKTPGLTIRGDLTLLCARYGCVGLPTLPITQHSTTQMSNNNDGDSGPSLADHVRSCQIMLEHNQNHITAVQPTLSTLCMISLPQQGLPSCTMYHTQAAAAVLC